MVNLGPVSRSKKKKKQHVLTDGRALKLSSGSIIMQLYSEWSHHVQCVSAEHIQDKHFCKVRVYQKPQQFQCCVYTECLMFYLHYALNLCTFSDPCLSTVFIISTVSYVAFLILLFYEITGVDFNLPIFNCPLCFHFLT